MIQNRLQTRQQLAARLAQQQGFLCGSGRVAHGNAHHEPVQLRLGQGKSAAGAERVLGRDHKEWIGQQTRRAFDRHLPFFHRFQQRALALGRGAVDLVGEHQLSENRARMKGELPTVPIKYRGPQDVTWQQVRGELNALITQTKNFRQRMTEGSLAHPRQVLDQQMPAADQTRHRQAYLRLLAQHHLIDRAQARIEFSTHRKPLPATAS